MFTRIEAARLMVYRACAAADAGGDFRQEASMAKYLTVGVARAAAAWAASLGEGTQDVQKLIVFREMMRKGFPS